MPNWTTNKLKITRNSDTDESKKTFLDIAEFVASKHGCFDFNNIIPEPDGVDWYEWCTINWGTKWNSYRALWRTESESLVYEFKSAWRPPIPVIRVLSGIFPGFIFDIAFFDEDFGNNVGRAVFRNGEEINIEIPEDFSCKAYEFIEQHFPGTAKERGYVLNPDTCRYEYAGE
jgi:hypothetical protein